MTDALRVLACLFVAVTNPFLSGIPNTFAADQVYILSIINAVVFPGVCPGKGDLDST